MSTSRPRSLSERFVTVLDTLADGGTPLTLSDVARRAGLPVSTAHRLLVEMVRSDMVERVGGRYRLGMHAWRLGLASPWEHGVRRVASPHAHLLAGELDSAVAISMLVGDRLVCMETIRGGQRVVNLSEPGDLLPLFATSAGKLLLAEAARTRVRGVLPSPLPQITPYTTTSPARLLAQLAAARKSGYAVSFAETSPGQSSVSVRVTTRPGETPLALTAIVPRTRQNLELLVPVLRRTADRIGADLVSSATS